LLEEFLGLECSFETENRLDVELRIVGLDGRLVLADGLFATPDDGWLADSSFPREPLARWPDAPTVPTPLPVLYGEGKLELGDREAKLALDVLGGAFFLLTRYEELVRSDRDEHERFPAAASLALRAQFLDRPLVNEYLEVLWFTLQQVWPSLERRPLEFRQLLTHDVDLPRCPKRTVLRAGATAIYDLVRRRDPQLALRRLRAVRPGRSGNFDLDPCNTFDFIMDASESRGLRSAFYFIAGRTGGAIDGDYSLDEPWIRRLLRRIHERGHELGLHTSYNTFRDSEQVRAEHERLRDACESEGIRQDAWGGRQHFLRWENPTTWQAWADAGLDYDSTVGFADAPGFRCGVCLDYPVFNVRTRRELPLRERPLIAMEKSLFHYRGMSRDEAVADIARLRDQCRRVGGQFTLLWHNDWLFTRRSQALYARALDG
jgi:uncharacterized protein DUF7033